MKEKKIYFVETIVYRANVQYDKEENLQDAIDKALQDFLNKTEDERLRDYTLKCYDVDIEQ